MVIVNVDVEGEPLNLYTDGILYEQLIKNVKPIVENKDTDYVITVDGEEGAGKSVFAFQIAKLLDPDFNINQVAFTSNDFIKLVIKSKKHQCIVFDEAFTGLSSRSALSETNQLLVQLMMEMRQKNLYIILVMPTFFMLDKYAVLHRTKVLFHVYWYQKHRGFWKLYNKKKMKTLYLIGKKFYEYNTPHSTFGRFRDQYTINESKYRELKSKALRSKKRSTRSEVYKNQRDTLFYIIVKELGISQTQTVKLCQKNGYKIAQNTISEIIEYQNKLKLQEN